MKPITSSKTAWVAALTIAAGVIGAVAASPVIAEYPRVASTLVAALGAVNLILRILTDEPVKLS